MQQHNIFHDPENLKYSQQRWEKTNWQCFLSIRHSCATRFLCSSVEGVMLKSRKVVSFMYQKLILPFQKAYNQEILLNNTEINDLFESVRVGL